MSSLIRPCSKIPNRNEHNLIWSPALSPAHSARSECPLPSSPWSSEASYQLHRPSTQQISSPLQLSSCNAVRGATSPLLLETTEEAALAEKDLPDIFQNIIFRVLPVCPLCIGISTSVRRAWESRTAVTACPNADCASRRLVWCLLKLLLALIPGLGFLLTFLALQILPKEKTTSHSCATSPREH